MIIPNGYQLATTTTASTMPGMDAVRGIFDSVVGGVWAAILWLTENVGGFLFSKVVNPIIWVGEHFLFWPAGLLAALYFTGAWGFVLTSPEEKVKPQTSVAMWIFRLGVVPLYSWGVWIGFSEHSDFEGILSMLWGWVQLSAVLGLLGFVWVAVLFVFIGVVESDEDPTGSEQG